MVSVVMATYNGEKYIEQQLESIRCQTQIPDEVIMCDDGSTDKTVEYIEKYIEKHKLLNWKIIKNEKNLGHFDNFFKAILLAQGDTIYLSDQDDIWDLNKIKVIEKYYMQNPSAMMIQSNMRFIDENSDKIEISYNYHGKKKTSGLILLQCEDMCKFAGSGYTMSFRKLVKEKIFENKLNKYKSVYIYHDILLGLMSTALGECYMCADIYDSHRLHDANATQTKKKSYVVDRTKEKQLTILNQRIQEFNLIMKITEKKIECFEKYKSFAQDRKDLIEKRKVQKIFRLLKNIKCYSSKFGLVTDVLYAFNFEKFLLFVYKKLWIP